MALEDYLKEKLVVLDWVSVPDGFGGFVWEWKDGVEFAAGVVKKQDTQMLIAEQSGAKTVYTIVVKASVALENGDRVRRLRDGAVFKITSDSAEMKTPDTSGMKFAQVTAERVATV